MLHWYFSGSHYINRYILFVEIVGASGTCQYYTGIRYTVQVRCRLENILRNISDQREIYP
jgi:hypothetical protein